MFKKRKTTSTTNMSEADSTSAGSAFASLQSPDDRVPNHQKQQAVADQRTPEVPKAPEGFEVTKTTTDFIELQWKRVTSNKLYGYRLRRSITFKNMWRSAHTRKPVLPPNTTRFKVGNVEPYVAYDFCLESAALDDRSDQLMYSEVGSKLQNVVAKGKGQPFPPRDVKVKDVKEESVSLTWLEPEPDDDEDENPVHYEYVIEMCRYTDGNNLNIWEACSEITSTELSCKVKVQHDGNYRFRVSACNRDRDISSLPQEMGDPELHIRITNQMNTEIGWLERLWKKWNILGTTPESQQDGSIVFVISCQHMNGLRELWMNYNLGNLKKLFQDLFAFEYKLAFDTELDIQIDPENFYDCRKHLLLTHSNSKGFRVVKVGDTSSSGTHVQLGLSEDCPVYCKPVLQRTAFSELDFLDLAIITNLKEQTGEYIGKELPHTTETTKKSPGTTEKSPGTTAKSPGTAEKSPGTTEKAPGATERSPGTSEKSPEQKTLKYQSEHISRKTLEAASHGRKRKQSESSEDDTTEVNEALMRAANTDHGRHPYRYGIASVNFKGDTRGTGNATLRKLLLGQLQEQARVSVIFVQECPWADPVGQLQLEEPFWYTGVVNEAGIIWNSELFDLKRLDSYKLIGAKYPNLIQHRGRICISEMAIKDQPTGHAASSNVAVEKKPNVKDFIAISWHGPHKCPDAEKQLIFRDLLAVFKTLTENKDGLKACVMGGDFNFSLDKACEIIDDSYPGLAFPTSYGLETIDYFIFTSDLINILHAQQLSLDYDVGSVYTPQDRDRARAETCKYPSNQVIDHSPVFGVLDLGSPNPFSSPSKIRDRKMAEPSKKDVTRNTPDCSMDGSTRSGATSDVPSSTKIDERQATICGLSRRVTLGVVDRHVLNVDELRLELRRRNITVGSDDPYKMSSQLWDAIDNREGQGTELEVEPNLSREVSLAVLPRLNKEELRRELEDRKDIIVTTEGSQEKLMKRLCDEMVKEYSYQLASSTSLGSSTRNRPMQDASTQREETNKAAPIPETHATSMKGAHAAPMKGAHSGPTGTADTEPMLRATTGAKGIDDAGAGKPRDSQEMQDAVRVGARPSMTESQNPGSWDAAGSSSIAVAKRTQEQETKFGPSIPLKRSKTGEETARKDVTMNVAPTSGNTRAAEATTTKTVPSLNFATPKSGIVTGAGPGSIAIPGMPSPQRAGNNLTCPCGYNARSKSDLQHHAVQTRHEPFQCDNCKCSFKTNYYQSLEKHQRTHEKKVDHDFLSSFPGRGFHY